jgi:hypothetical protein
MPEPNRRARLLALPTDLDPGGGRLDAVTHVKHGRRHDLIVDYQALRLLAPPVLFEAGGRIQEQVEGVYWPRRLRFAGVQIESGAGLGERLRALPPDDPGRILRGTLQWRTPRGSSYYVIRVCLEVDPVLQFTARWCLAEPRPGEPQPAAYTRDWSSPPSSSARLVPAPRRLWQRFGGNPVTVQLAGRSQGRRLFIGGLDEQSEWRPAVDAVLNLSETHSRWAQPDRPDPRDRWETKKEGAEGMPAAEIAAEARWVIDHLQAGRRVLVHCSAGMNRSATVCCGVLILLEGLTAEAALARVREHHPWARPDSYHWLALRWLAHQNV